MKTKPLKILLEILHQDAGIFLTIKIIVQLRWENNRAIKLQIFHCICTMILRVAADSIIEMYQFNYTYLPTTIIIIYNKKCD